MLPPPRPVTTSLAMNTSALPLPRLPGPPVWLGLAGVLPQALCLALTLTRPEDRWFALAAGCCYAAIILSFLGGLWWMAALQAGERAAGPYVWAVLASLGGWAAMLPWCLGWEWPGPALVLLGLALLASPMVDRRLPGAGALPPAWLRLRVIMASGLGLTTILLGWLA
jgi:hypothetical protein